MQYQPEGVIRDYPIYCPRSFIGRFPMSAPRVHAQEAAEDCARDWLLVGSRLAQFCFVLALNLLLLAAMRACPSAARSIRPLLHFNIALDLVVGCVFCLLGLVSGKTA